MGQRHQFYIRVNVTSQANKVIEKKMIAFHHQWAYGSLPLWCLRWLLEFNSHADEYSKFSHESYSLAEVKDCISSLISTNAAQGYRYHVSDITDETNEGTNPGRGDNNDGITMVDFTGDKPVYAFLTSKGFEETLEICNAKQYASDYYSPGSEEWKHFDIDAQIKFIEKHARLMTPDEMIELFPEYCAELKKERAQVRNAGPDLPCLVTGDGLKFPDNKKLAEYLLKGDSPTVKDLTF